MAKCLTYVMITLLKDTLAGYLSDFLHTQAGNKRVLIARSTKISRPFRSRSPSHSCFTNGPALNLTTLDAALQQSSWLPLPHQQLHCSSGKLVMKKEGKCLDRNSDKKWLLRAAHQLSVQHTGWSAASSLSQI